MDKIKNEMIDTKLVVCQDGFTYQLNRTRQGFLDTINLSYATKSGMKTISRRMPSVLGWATQTALEFAIPLI
ncbi:hypothetical protein [Clostridium sp. JN-9]|uniref:hypothetical protein n=1 Tax=Clostridium sp. JN-9 TaxID=2507159 RepID=UPI000FFE26DA|nr:hypothetical protein [Clostridium sp. JN-9]QAT39543.1 hypothetical protein EQM05_04350 [Clostridium sp. JN-9]